MSCGSCGVGAAGALPAMGAGTFFANTLAGRFAAGGRTKRSKDEPSMPRQQGQLAADPKHFLALQQATPEGETAPGSGVFVEEDGQNRPVVAEAPVVRENGFELEPDGEEKKQFGAFASDLFGSSVQETASPGQDVSVMSSYAKGSGMKWTLPNIVDPEMAIDAGMHLLAKAFFYEDELALAVQLLRSHSGAPLPTAELKGADGAVIRTFKFDLEFMKALMRRMTFTAGMYDAMKPLLIFCCYCITIRDYLYQLQSYETMLQAAELEGNNKKPIADGLLPNLYESKTTEAANITKQSIEEQSAVYGLVQITRGLWKWPTDSDAGSSFAAFRVSATTGPQIVYDENKWVYETDKAITSAAGAPAAPVVGGAAPAPNPAAAAKPIQDAMIVAFKAIPWFNTSGKDLSLVARLARAAWRSYFCDAIVRRFYQVAQRYSDFIEKTGKQADGPFMADADFLKTGGTAPNGSGRACPPGHIPTLEIPKDAGAQARFKAANGGPPKNEQKAAMDGMTGPFAIGIEEARVPGTQMLKPGVEVTGCLPARQLGDTVQGTQLQQAPVVDPFGQPLPVPSGGGRSQMGFDLSGGSGQSYGGVPYQFHGNTLTVAAPAEGMSGVSASSPLIQQYFQHFHAPPFRAMMITPKV